jgi:hypothetical protein
VLLLEGQRLRAAGGPALLRFSNADDETARLEIGNAGQLRFGPGGTTGTDAVLLRRAAGVVGAADGNSLGVQGVFNAGRLFVGTTQLWVDSDGNLRGAT